MKSRTRAWILLVLVNLGWAAQYPAYRIASDAIGVASLNFWTFAIASLVLLPALWHERRGKMPKTQPFTRADLAQYALLALLGLIPPSVVMAWGIAHSSAANASILSLTIPVLMTCMGVLMLGEQPGRMIILSLICACLGTALISWSDIKSGKFSGATLVGNVAVFLSGAGAAFYNAYCKKLLARHGAVEILVYGYLGAAILCAAISFFFDPHPFYVTAGWGGLSWLAIGILGVVVWGLAMLIWMRVLEDLSLGQISVSVYMLPVFGVALSAITLGERVHAAQFAGAAVVLISAYLSSGNARE